MTRQALGSIVVNVSPRVATLNKEVPVRPITGVIFLSAMNVAVCQIRLRLPENLSLKGKRQVLKSITTKVGNKFNVSVAEVDDHDLWQLATLGICCVSNSKRHANEILSKVVDFITNSRFDIEILDYKIEILSV